MYIYVKNIYTPHEFVSTSAYDSLARMNIARLRKLRGWSQTDLAEIIGVEQPTISRMEKGHDSVTLRQLKAAAEALGTPLYLIFVDDSSDAEMRLMDIYRSLPADRRKGWLDMAHLAKSQNQKENL